MQNKDINTNGNVKINRYNQIDLIGCYGMKDNFNIGAPARRSEKNEVISVFKWLGIFILISIPVVGFIALIVMACTDVNLNVKNFAKATLIFMFIGLIAFLLFL